MQLISPLQCRVPSLWSSDVRGQRPWLHTLERYTLGWVGLCQPKKENGLLRRLSNLCKVREASDPWVRNVGAARAGGEAKSELGRYQISVGRSGEGFGKGNVGISSVV